MMAATPTTGVQGRAMKCYDMYKMRATRYKKVMENLSIWDMGDISIDKWY